MVSVGIFPSFFKTLFGGETTNGDLDFFLRLEEEEFVLTAEVDFGVAKDDNGTPAALTGVPPLLLLLSTVVSFARDSFSVLILSGVLS